MITATQIENMWKNLIPRPDPEESPSTSRLSIPYDLRAIIPEKLNGASLFDIQKNVQNRFRKDALDRPYDVSYDEATRTTSFWIAVPGWSKNDIIIGMMDVDNGIFEISFSRTEKEIKKAIDARWVRYIPTGNWTIRFKIDNPQTDRINWDVNDGILYVSIYVSKPKDCLKKQPALVAFPPGIPWNNQIKMQNLKDQVCQHRWFHFQGARQSGKSTYLAAFVSRTMNELTYGQRMIMVFAKYETIEHHKELLNKVGCNFNPAAGDTYQLPNGGGIIEFMTYDEFIATSMKPKILVVDEIEFCDAEDKILALMCEGTKIISTGSHSLASMLNSLEYSLEKSWSIE